MEPTAFDADLRSGVTTGKVKFTASGDLDIVSKQYEKGFTSSLSGTESMYFAKLGWADEEVEKLCNSLKSLDGGAKRLVRLRLHSRNELTDKSAEMLCKIMSNGYMPRLELLNVEGNRLSEEGLNLLAVVCSFKDVKLQCDQQEENDVIEKIASAEELMASAPAADAASLVPHFKVTAGVLAGAYNAVYLSTDLEPDDVVAIKALAPAFGASRCSVSSASTPSINGG